jgi:hypothetical protein
MNQSANSSNKKAGNWRLVAIFAFFTTLIMLGLFYYWFAVADRYVIFLYNHDMPPQFPDTSPFSQITSSRYWMAGLVASGFVLVLYSSGNLLLGRLISDYRPPAWWQVWSLSSLPLAILLPLITMTANRPVLPFGNALPVTLVTLIGLALALSPGRIAAQDPAGLFLLTLDGFGLMLIVLIVSQIPRLIELSSRGLVGFIVVAILGLAAGFFLLLFSTVIYKWRRKTIPGSFMVLTAGLCVAYPLMALVHHLYVGLTGGYFYISDGDNFFARSLWPNLLAWLLAAAIVVAITRLRQHLVDEHPPSELQAVA